jgi:hypothetical protein
MARKSCREQKSTAYFEPPSVTNKKSFKTFSPGANVIKLSDLAGKLFTWLENLSGNKTLQLIFHLHQKIQKVLKHCHMVPML